MPDRLGNIMLCILTRISKSQKHELNFNNTCHIIISVNTFINCRIFYQKFKINKKPKIQDALHRSFFHSMHGDMILSSSNN